MPLNPAFGKNVATVVHRLSRQVVHSFMYRWLCGLLTVCGPLSAQLFAGRFSLPNRRPQISHSNGSCRSQKFPSGLAWAAAHMDFAFSILASPGLLLMARQLSGWIGSLLSISHAGISPAQRICAALSVMWLPCARVVTVLTSSFHCSKVAPGIADKALAQVRMTAFDLLNFQPSGDSLCVSWKMADEHPPGHFLASAISDASPLHLFMAASPSRSFAGGWPGGWRRPGRCGGCHCVAAGARRATGP